MESTQTTASAARTVLPAILAASLALPGCLAPKVRETGESPRGEIQPRESLIDRVTREHRDESRRRREDAQEAKEAQDAKARAAAAPTATPSGTPTGAIVRTSVTGTARSQRFHRTDCPLLADAPAAERITFVSAFDALDGGFAPCAQCRPE